MLGSLRDLHPGSSLAHIVFFEFCRRACQFVLWLLYRVRVSGRENIPRTGPVLIVANHQSFLDPPLIGGFITCRHTDFIARAGLFRFGPFGRLISVLNSVPIAEQGGDTAAMKEALRRLEQGRAVLIFPEGSRSPDGAMRPFKRGAAVIVKRSGCPVLPVAIEGVHDAWPRHRSRPFLVGHRISVRYGEAIPHAALMAEGPDAALRRLEEAIDGMRIELRAELRARTGGRLPAAGAGDRAMHGADPG
jgi:1-acyl-sn-glycerol-3-phosphate acyltransferase